MIEIANPTQVNDRHPRPVLCPSNFWDSRWIPLCLRHKRHGKNLEIQNFDAQSVRKINAAFIRLPRGKIVK